MTSRATPCEARPSTGFRHLDGACRCFVGGPAPEFGPGRALPRFAGLGDPDSTKVSDRAESADVAGREGEG